MKGDGRNGGGLVGERDSPCLHVYFDISHKPIVRSNVLKNEFKAFLSIKTIIQINFTYKILLKLEN